jgi:predicted dehydrogenase
VGLIGCGGMGRSLGTQLVQLENARLIGVADPNPEAVERLSKEFSAPGYASAEQLIEQPGIDAVIIASPGFAHRSLSELAAARGKHIFLEKPMATNTADCDAITAAVERADVTLMIGQVLRYYPTWNRIIELVEAGEIGEPWAVSVTRLGSGWTGWTQPWRNSLEQSGGLLMEVNAHEIDFMCRLCGDVDRVYAEADHYGAEDPSDYPNQYYLSLRFRSGATGMLHASTLSTMNDMSGRIQGSEGTILYTDGFGGDNARLRWKRRDGDERFLGVADISVEQPVRKELRLFIESVLSGTPPPITAAEGRRNVAVAEAAYRSARTAQPVTL